MNPRYLVRSVLIGLFILVAPHPLRADLKGAQKKAFAGLMGDDVENIGQFEKIAAKAKTAGVPAQAILEAKLIFCIKADAVDALPDLLPRLEAGLNDWRETDSPVFNKRSELEGLIHMAKGLVAGSQGADDVFEYEMKAAFWADPSLAEPLAQRVTAFREKQRMQTLVMPMELEFETSQGGKTTLAKLIAGKKALLLDFWASWCSPCMASMNDLRSRAEKLALSGIVVVGMNTESDRSKAEKVRKEKKMPMAWLVEPEEETISELLGIDSIPRAVLVTPDGKIAFNGHPESPELEAALARISGTAQASK